MPSVPILTYHSLDPSGSVISVRPDQFRRHMSTLQARGFRGIALGDLVGVWEGRWSLEGRPLVLTFDDGFRNTGEVAGPVLAEFGFRATVFAVADACGKSNRWSGPDGTPELPLLTTAELRALPADTFEVGAHGVTHMRLDRLSDPAAETEVRVSRQKLEQILGREVTLFAYPYGIADQRVREYVRKHYRAACGVEMGFASPRHDRHWLPRLDAYYMRDPRLFRFLGTTRGNIYLRLRAAGRALKHALRPRVPYGS